MKVSLIQMDIAFGDPDKNYRKAEKLIARALKSAPDVVLLPELWTTGYDLSRLDDIADRDAARTKQFAGRLARNHRINIVAGSVAKRTDSGTKNTLLFFNRNGQCAGAYEKVHLFRLMNEDRFLESGNRDGRFSVDGVQAAGFICYDIRFPEWIRKQVLSGAKMLFVPAEWPKPRLDHWRTLLISRAIENQSFVIACNRCGSDPDNVFAGHSIVVGPWGEIIAEAGEEEAVLTADIDPGSIDAVRSRIPVFEDRRPELYN